jgi:hypothetical protein
MISLPEATVWWGVGSPITAFWARTGPAKAAREERSCMMMMMMMMMMNCKQRALSYGRREKMGRKIYEEARVILNQKKHFGP